MKKDGFTLIELLIVVAIIGILAAIAVPNFSNAQIKAKLSRVESDLRTISTALTMYRLDNNDPPYDGEPGSAKYPWIESYSMLTTPISYINSILVDPFQATDTTFSPPEAWYLGGKPVEDGGMLSYDYGTAYWHGFTGNSSHGWYQGWRESTWKIGSPGPDLQYRNMVMTSGWVSGHSYDISNGLVSAGDIARGENYYSKSSKQRGL